MGINTEKTYRFPVELLACDKQQKKEYFMSYVTPHPSLDNAVNKTIAFLNSPISERLIFVCGPSGVGKKEFINNITDRVMNEFASSCLDNPGYIPIVNVEATAPEQGSFNFTNLWKQALANLDEPLIDSKVTYTIENRLNLNGQYVPYSKMSKADYQEVLVNALNFRGVKVMVINEAHHMLRVATSKKANWSVDLFKTLSNRSQTRIILVGTYELCAYLEDLDYTVTDQINQRTKIVDFPRYNNNSADEVNAFAKAAKKMLLHMPFEQTSESLVDSDWEFLYNYSLGCIGTLKNWFMDAYSFALDSNSNTLTLKHLKETKLPWKRLSLMLDSITDGEHRMEELLSDGDFLSKMSPVDKESGKKTKENQSNQNPFGRRPTRDKVNIR